MANSCFFQGYIQGKKEDEYKIVTDAPWIKVYLDDSEEIMEYVYDYIYTLF